MYCLREAHQATGGFDERFYASEEIHFSRALKRWGRRRGLRFCMLDHPLITSSRKLDWYGPGVLARALGRVLLRPWLLRRREACALWYERPRLK